MPDSKTYDAEVPVSDYNVLLKSGVIKDPFYGTNEKDALYIGETDKTFSRKFNLDKDFLKNENIMLQCCSLNVR